MTDAFHSRALVPQSVHLLSKLHFFRLFSPIEDKL